MSQIELYPGITWQTRPLTTVAHLIDLDTLRERLAEMRAELTEAARADGITLDELQVSAGMMLDDFEALLPQEVTSE